VAGNQGPLQLGNTVSSNPRMPGQNLSASASAVSRFSRIFLLDSPFTMTGGTQFAYGAGRLLGDVTTPRYDGGADTALRPPLRVSYLSDHATRTPSRGCSPAGWLGPFRASWPPPDEVRFYGRLHA